MSLKEKLLKSWAQKRARREKELDREGLQDFFKMLEMQAKKDRERAEKCEQKAEAQEKILSTPDEEKS